MKLTSGFVTFLMENTKCKGEANGKQIPFV